MYYAYSLLLDLPSAPTTSTVTVDMLATDEFAGALQVNSSGLLEDAIASQTNYGTSVDSSTALQSYFVSFNEFSSYLKSDAFVFFVEELIACRQDLGSYIEELMTQRSDFSSYADLISGVRTSSITDFDNIASIISDALLLGEFVIAVKNDNPIKIESSSAQNLDFNSNAELTGSVAVNSDSKILIEITNALRADSKATFDDLYNVIVSASSFNEAGASVTSDDISRIELTAAQRTDANARFEVMTSVRSDQAEMVTEINSGIFSQVSMLAEVLGAIAVTSDGVLATEFSSAFQLNYKFALENIVRMLEDSQSSDEGVIKIIADANNRIEGSSFQRSDSALNAEIMGGIGITSDSGIIVEFISSLRKDHMLLTEYSGRIITDILIAQIEASASQVSDAFAKNEQASQVYSDSKSIFEFVNSLRSDASYLFESVSRFIADSAVARIEAVSAQISDALAKDEQVTAIRSESNLLIESSNAVSIGVANVPAESLGTIGVTNDGLIVIESASTQRADHSVRIDQSLTVYSDNKTMINNLCDFISKISVNVEDLGAVGLTVIDGGIALEFSCGIINEGSLNTESSSRRVIDNAGLAETLSRITATYNSPIEVSISVPGYDYSDPDEYVPLLIQIKFSG